MICCLWQMSRKIRTEGQRTEGRRDTPPQTLLKGEVRLLLHPEDKKVPRCCPIRFHRPGKFQLSGFVIEANQSFLLCLLSFEKSLICYFLDSFYVTISNVCPSDLVRARLAENDPVFGSSKLLRHLLSGGNENQLRVFGGHFF